MLKTLYFALAIFLCAGTADSKMSDDSAVKCLSWFNQLKLEVNKNDVINKDTPVMSNEIYMSGGVEVAKKKILEERAKNETPSLDACAETGLELENLKAIYNIAKMGDGSKVKSKLENCAAIAVGLVSFAEQNQDAKLHREVYPLTVRLGWISGAINPPYKPDFADIVRLDKIARGITGGTQVSPYDPKIIAAAEECRFVGATLQDYLNSRKIDAMADSTEHSKYKLYDLPEAKIENINGDLHSALRQKYPEGFLRALDKDYPELGLYPHPIVGKVPGLIGLIVGVILLSVLFHYIHKKYGELMKALGLIVNVVLAVIFFMALLANGFPESVKEYAILLVGTFALVVNIWNHIRLKTPESKFFLFQYFERKGIEEKIKLVEAQDRLNALKKP